MVHIMVICCPVFSSSLPLTPAPSISSLGTRLWSYWPYPLPYACVLHSHLLVLLCGICPLLNPCKSGSFFLAPQAGMASPFSAVSALSPYCVTDETQCCPTFVHTGSIRSQRELMQPPTALELCWHTAAKACCLQHWPASKPSRSSTATSIRWW